MHSFGFCSCTSPVPVAGIDYEAPTEIQLAYSSSSSASMSFEVTIKSDNHTERREFFEVAIRSFFVRSNTDSTQQLLTEQERNRIVISPERAQIFITDSMLITFMKHFTW